MSKQPEALRHADKLDAHEFDEPHGAAAELRRSHSKIVDLEESVRILLTVVSERDRIEAQRDALLEALRTLLSYATTLEMRLLDADGEHRAMRIARAAIAKAEEA